MIRDIASSPFMREITCITITSFETVTGVETNTRILAGKLASTYYSAYSSRLITSGGSTRRSIQAALSLLRIYCELSIQLRTTFEFPITSLTGVPTTLMSKYLKVKSPRRYDILWYKDFPLK
jgi:hypothetical protein